MIKKTLLAALLQAALAFAPAVWADYMVLDTGEIMPSGNYKFTGDVQALTEDAGLNASVRGDMGINDDIGIRGVLGFGKMDMYGGALVKWTPVKDDGKNAPALGGNAGLLFVSDGDYRDMIVRVEPLISKKLDIEEVTLIPYASFPVNFRARKAENDFVDDENDVALQLVLGTQLRIPQVVPELQFIAEVGIDINEAPGYIGFGAIYYLDTVGETESITQ
jgi:hypothetical protein